MKAPDEAERPPAPAHGVDDFAIVVGVPAGGPASPDGPDRARAFYDWLVAPDGGAVPQDRVELMLLDRAADRPPETSVREWFDGLELPRLRRTGAWAGRAGRRLYFYASGPADEMPSRQYVLLAPTSREQPRTPSVWIQGFVTSVCDAGLFDEVVAFADLVMDPTETSRQERSADLARRKLPESLMAPSGLLFGLSVVTSWIPREETGTTFTDVVVAGLRGRARDNEGRVTGQSLIRYVSSSEELSGLAMRQRPWFEVRDTGPITLVGRPPTVDGKSSPDVWLLSGADSDLVLTRAASSNAPGRPREVWLRANVTAGDVVFLQGDEGPVVVGVARVRAVREPGIRPSDEPGRGRHVQFDEAMRFDNAVEAPRAGSVVQDIEQRADRSEPLTAGEGALLCGAVIARNPDVIDDLAGLLGIEQHRLAYQVCEAALLHGTPDDVGRVVPAAVRSVRWAALSEILDLTRSVEPARRRLVLGAFARALRATAPGRAAVLSALRNDDDPEVRALAAPPPTAARSDSFTYACFFDSAALEDRSVAAAIATLAGRVANGIRAVRREPMWFFAGGPDDADWMDRALAAMPKSACILLLCTDEVTRRPLWQSLVRHALELEETWSRRFRDAGIDGHPSLIVPVAVDSFASLTVELRERQAVDATALVGSMDDEPSWLIVETIVDEVVRRCNALDVLATVAPRQRATQRPAPAPLSHDEAIARIELVSGDLLELDVDAIVNPVGVSPRMSGEIGGQIADLFGEEAFATPDFDRMLTAGETIIMPTAGRLPARFIVHTCTDGSLSQKTEATITAGAIGAIDAADRLREVRTIGIPSLGTGAARAPVAAVAPTLLPAVVERLERGTHLERVVFVFRDEHVLATYRDVLEELRASAMARGTEAAIRVAGRQLFLAASPAVPGPVLVGRPVPVSLSLLLEPAPNAVPLLIPRAALELTVYIDAPGFQLDGPGNATVRVIDGQPDTPAVIVSLTPLAAGRYDVEFAVHVRGSGATASTIATTTIEVEPAVELPDIPELIDRRRIPNPQPDVVLYVATERLAGAERLRLHVTCATLGYDRRTLDPPLRLTSADTAAIRHAAALAAAGADTASPLDVEQALRAFGAAIFDVLAPAGHPLRDFVWHLLTLREDPDRPPSLLVVSDEEAMLPWELVCPHGYDDEARHHYGEFLGSHFVIGHWIGRKGLVLAEEAPIGPLGVVHYGQRPDILPVLRSALGGEQVVGVADPEWSLEIMRPDSPFFGVHLLRYSDAAERGRVAAADDTPTPAAGRTEAAPSLARDRRLDFTVRRPVVGLSLVDDELDAGGSTSDRDTRLEPAWSLPFLQARVTAVVGPRWTTSPTADRAFYRAFYGAVRSGATLGQAVFDARQLVKSAHPDRADWLAYTYFGHPHCAPYEVQPAEGFTLFEPLGVREGEPFEAGRTYRFRASYRSELPAWFGGRRRVRREPLHGEGVSVLVAPLLGGQPTKLELVPVGEGARADDDCHQVIELTMPEETTELPVLVQFTRDARELQSTIVRLDVRKVEVATT